MAIGLQSADSFCCYPVTELKGLFSWGRQGGSSPRMHTSFPLLPKGGNINEQHLQGWHCNASTQQFCFSYHDASDDLRAQIQPCAFLRSPPSMATLSLKVWAELGCDCTPAPAMLCCLCWGCQPLWRVIFHQPWESWNGKYPTSVGSQRLLLITLTYSPGNAAACRQGIHRIPRLARG